MSACLTCGGTLALFPSGHWKHTSVPEGFGAHQARRAETDRETIEARGRAMLDAAAEWNRTHRPAGMQRESIEAALESDRRGSVDDCPPRRAPHPPPAEPARDAFDSEIPKSGRGIMELLAAHGWRLLASAYSRGYKMGTLAPIENFVLWADREVHREKVVVWWEDSGYGGGYHLSPYGTEPVNYTELRKIITTLVMVCDTCGLPPLAHPIPRESPDCFQEE